MSVLDEITFRQFEYEDVGAVWRLHEEALRAVATFDEVQEDKDLLDIQANYIDNGGDFIVGLIDGEIVAMAGFRKLTETQAELKRMRVKPELQGQGIGAKLLNMIEKLAKAHGYTTITLDCSEQQEVANNLYKRNGYEEYKRAKSGTSKIICYRKDLNYFRQHDLDL